MGELVVKPSLTDRMVRAARLETSLYNEVEVDLSATNEALTVVVVTALAGGIGAALGQAFAGPRMNGTLVLSSAATEARLVKPLSATTPANCRPRSWRTRQASSAAMAGSGVLPVARR